MAAPNLEGQNGTSADTITLTPLSKTDIPAIVAAYNDDSATEFMNIPQPFTEAHAEALVQDSQNLAIRSSDDTSSPLLGTIALRGRPPTGDIGGITLTPLSRGKGVATTAVQLLIARAWALGFTALEWECLAANTRSSALAQRVGFKLDRMARSKEDFERHKNKDVWIGVIKRP